MKYLKTYESLVLNDAPVKDEYIIVKLNTVFIVIQITTTPRPSTDYIDLIYVFTWNIINKTHSEIFYNTETKNFSLGNGIKCKVLWRGYNKDEAIREYETIILADKYNL